ncbi:hypothetical protein ABIE13_002403 [Ottowia thiooxydans]|uniref:Uncharacterized protein n=1 Tax=Ottowia thiooxydans TaxID=219182 RepID=A0ABV2Q8G2_9BURK
MRSRVKMGCAEAPLPLRRAGDGTRPSRQRLSIRGPSEAMARVGIPPLWPCRGAQGQRRAVAPQDAIASCSSLRQLFEQRERSERREFCRTAFGASTTGCPQRSAGTRTVGPPFLAPGSFGGPKEGGCAAGRTPRPPTSMQEQRLICERSDQSTAACPHRMASPPTPLPKGEGVKRRTFSSSGRRLSGWERAQHGSLSRTLS